MKYVVYCHQFPNGKRYIGITHQAVEYRWEHGKGYRNQPLVYRAVTKYGWDNIQHKILAEDLTKQEACELEKFYIAKYNTQDNRFGYNLTAGGEGHTGYTPTSETREKISKALQKRGNSFITDEWREKLRIANTGKHHSEETKKKISEAGKRRGTSHVTSEYRQKLSDSLKGNTNALGTVQPSEANKKRSDALKGIPKSEETKIKMRKPKSESARANMKKAQEARWAKYYAQKEMSQSDQGRVGR